MLTSGIKFNSFKFSPVTRLFRQNLNHLLKNKNQVLDTLTNNYKLNYNKKKISKYKKSKNFRIIGMGGSILGTKAIYDFLNHKIKKNFFFVDNLKPTQKKENRSYSNIIVSKSGNTLETIVNTNILIKKNEKNIFITENKQNYLNLLAKKLRAEIIHHNNYIGGRYSVLSEVGMLPAELMGLDPSKFKQFNSLIKNKRFIKSLLSSVASSISFIKKEKFNSIILNYDEKSQNLFKWYQQLIAESLGKKNNGILPVISLMPRDNHSLMQLYLDGFKNNFFTFFYVN